MMVPDSSTHAEKKAMQNGAFLSCLFPVQEFGKTKIYTALQEAGDDLSKEVSDHISIMCTVMCELPMPCSLSHGLQCIGKASGAT
jgi:hypothetical protein